MLNFCSFSMFYEELEALITNYSVLSSWKLDPPGETSGISWSLKTPGIRARFFIKFLYESVFFLRCDEIIYIP